MAYLVGTLLVVLVFVGIPLQWFGDDDRVDVVLGTAHGYLYMVLLLSIADLWRRRRFPLKAVVLVALAGTIPLLSFYAERQITARIHDGRY